MNPNDRIDENNFANYYTSRRKQSEQSYSAFKAYYPPRSDRKNSIVTTSTISNEGEKNENIEDSRVCNRNIEFTPVQSKRQTNDNRKEQYTPFSQILTYRNVNKFTPQPKRQLPSKERKNYQ